MESARLAPVVALACILVACAQESTVETSIRVRSTAFSNNAAIPARYTCSGADVSTPLTWSGVPSAAQSLALTVIDPDAPGKPFVHWLVFNLPGSATELPEGGPPPGSSLQGRNDFGSLGYRGPCPPPGSPHHYHFKLHALDTMLSLRSGTSESEFRDAIRGHVLGEGELIGTFRR
jgi:Raf kinase inhibitor-like YbhB/YbcL family protein